MNYEDIVSLAHDRQKENQEWIERETKLMHARGTLEPRSNEGRESKLRWAMDMVQSIALLLIPGVGQKANR